MEDLMDRSYDEFEERLKDLLSWYQQAVHQYDKDSAKRREHVASTGFMIPSVSTTSLDNARQAILNHCHAFDKKRKRDHGIL
jgi:DNA phosphorothioation-dependent restriction protein DptG